MALNSFNSYGYHLFFVATSIISGAAIPHITECGDLSIEQPAILGRNVTFTFTPSVHRYDKSATLLWQRTNKNNPWSTLRGSNFDQFMIDGTFYFIVINTVSTETKDDAIFYRIQYFNDTGNCTMETPKLELKDISGGRCGFVYRRTAKIEYGEDVELEYFPKKAEIDYPHTYSRVWVLSNSQGIKSKLSNMKGVYQERATTNDKYVLTIFSYKDKIKGNYSVSCDVDSSYSNEVAVSLPDPPNKPVFEGLNDIEECKNCFVGEDRAQFNVFCKISGGTEPVTVTIAIGNETQYVAQEPKKGGYWAFFYLYNRHHMTNMTCSVMNDALVSPLTATALVYVIKTPTFKDCEIPSKLREGESVNITCKFAAGRPTPTLSLKIFGTELSPVQQNDIVNIIDQSYTSVISLTTFKRSWNGQYISCCRFSKWYKPQNDCDRLGQVKYLFPPTDVKLEIETEENPTRVYAVCTIYGSNPVCKAKWQAPSGSIHSERSSKNTSNPFGAWDSEYRVTVNISQDHPGGKITCSADCSNVSVSKHTSVFLPYAPVIEFNTSNSVLDIYKGSEVHVKCTASSSPQSNISWIEHTTDGEVSMTFKPCQHATYCIISVKGDNIMQRNLACNTQHLLGSDSKNLTINIIDANMRKKDTSLAPIVGGISGAVVMTTVSVLVAVVLVWRRKSLARRGPNNIELEERSNYDYLNTEYQHQTIYTSLEKVPGTNNIELEDRSNYDNLHTEYQHQTIYTSLEKVPARDEQAEQKHTKT